MAVCFLLALRTGMRAGDLTGLTWANIHSQHAAIEIDKVGRRKGIGRDVPLSKKSIRVLNKMRGFDTLSVFSLKPQTLDSRFRDIRERVGLTVRDDKGEILESTLHFHDTRHTAATWIGLSGKLTLIELCNMFGWSDPKMALRYFNPKPASIANKLD
jgi:integrase